MQSEAITASACRRVSYRRRAPIVVAMTVAVSLYAIPASGAPAGTAVPNMNGDYTIANSDTFPTNFMSYPGGVESFDAYHGPIETVYSQVWWTSATDSIPQEVVERFDGKVMAIVGVEMDQVQRTPAGDVSVPISWAYNHHHNTFVLGKGAHMERVSRTDPRATSSPRKWAPLSGGTHVWLPVEHQPSTTGMPTSAMFDDGNGGEYRKSLHMYGPPFAQLVESPQQISGLAMQIDTWNRAAMNSTRAPFVPGPYPKHNLAPVSGPDAIYSGLLECPLTSRIQKIFDGSSDFNDSFKAMAFDCHAAPPAFCVENDVNGISGDVPTAGQNASGLTYAGETDSAAACEALCNASAQCTSFTWVSPAFGQAEWRRMCYVRWGGRAETTKTAGIVTGWRGNCGSGPSPAPQKKRCANSVATAADCFAAAADLVGTAGGSMATRVVGDSSAPAGCSLVAGGRGAAAATTMAATATFNTNANSTACCDVGPTSDVAGTAGTLGGAVVLRLNVSGSTGLVTMTLTGPSAVWFGVGFGAELMGDDPYTVVVDGTGAVSERKLGNHLPGTVLQHTVHVISASVANGQRTVVLTRSVVGATADHFTFSPTDLVIDIIAAIGQGAAFGPHNTAPHGADSVRLWPAGRPVCVCRTPADPFGQGTGKIKYLPTGETVGFGGDRCPPQPRGDLLAQRNPTCDLRTYVGGLATCHHSWLLLDAEQEVPWQDRPLRYYKKFRVYFQEYKPEHTQIVRLDWGVGAGGNHDEYDVPQCHRDTATPECNHTITGTWVPVADSEPEAHLVALHHHCHAPTCLLVETFNNDTGELLCRTAPVYGGTGGYVADKPQFNEAGYIATPPCMWGSQEHGLKPPPRMNGMTIRVVATTNSTYGHHGEMALPQAMIAWGPLPKSTRHRLAKTT